jgi:hypothetical protein
MRLIYRAGRLTATEDRLTLTLSANRDVQTGLLHHLKAAT